MLWDKLGYVLNLWHSAHRANYLYPAHSFWMIELGVLLVETLLFALLFGVCMRRGALLSFAANIATIALSLVMFAI